MIKATQYCSYEQCGPWALCIGGSFFNSNTRSMVFYVIQARSFHKGYFTL